MRGAILHPPRNLARGILDRVEDADMRSASAQVGVKRAGDALMLSIAGPEGQVITDRLFFEKTQSMAFRAIGRKLGTAGWPSGHYIGETIMMRGATELGRQDIALTVAP